jgi:hypothetical protein
MSSSSRSIAAARQKRAGEQSQPMNTSRPVTSISSQGAFAQQYQQQMMSQNIPGSSKNIRVAQNRSQSQNIKSTQNMQQQEQSTKISVSNAIGLITLRLGKLEKFIQEVNEDGGFNNNNNDIDSSSIPSNMKLVSDEVFENIVNRLNLLESKVINFNNQNEIFVKNFSTIQSSVDNLNTKLSSFINETNERFTDYENALAEIEQNFEVDATVNDIIIQDNDDNEGHEDNEDGAYNEDNQDSENEISNDNLENTTQHI